MPEPDLAFARRNYGKCPNHLKGESGQFASYRLVLRGYGYGYGVNRQYVPGSLKITSHFVVVYGVFSLCESLHIIACKCSLVNRLRMHQICTNNLS